MRRLLPLLLLGACAPDFPARLFYDDPSTDFDGDGFTDNAGDCDDSNPTIYPTAPEICDALDNDCDVQVDEDIENKDTWYLDGDGDGQGSILKSVEACRKPEATDQEYEYVSNSDDCDDNTATVKKGATEICDHLDNDCDGQIDEVDALDAVTWYLDIDQDGYGSPYSDNDEPAVGCDAPPSYTAMGGDCND